MGTPEENELARKATNEMVRERYAGFPASTVLDAHRLLGVVAAGDTPVPPGDTGKDEG